MNVPRWRSRDDRGQANKPLTRVRTRFAWKFYDRPTCVTIASDTLTGNRVNRKTLVARNADERAEGGFFVRVRARLFTKDLLFTIDAPSMAAYFQISFADIFGFYFFEEEKKVELWTPLLTRSNIVLPLMPPIFLLISSFLLMISVLSSFFLSNMSKQFLSKIFFKFKN